MTQDQPLQLSVQVSDRLNALIFNGGHYGAVSEFERRRILADIAVVAKSDAAAAFTLQALLASFDGDKPLAFDLLDKVHRLGRVADANKLRLLVLTNLGYMNDGFALARELVHAGAPDLSLLLQMAIAAGAVETAARAVQESADSSQVLSAGANEHILVARRAARALNEVGGTERQLSAMLDAAGVTMREQRLIWLDYGPRVVIHTEEDGLDEGSHLQYFFRVDLPPRDAARMSNELARRLVRDKLDFDGFGVSFTGTFKQAVSA